MKKKYIIIFLVIVAGISITPFIFMTFIPRYYLQVQSHEEYIWEQNIYQPSYADFSDDTADLFNYQNLDNIDKIKIDIGNISDEIVSGSYKYRQIGIAYYMMFSNSSTDWILNSSINSIIVYDYNANNYTFTNIIQAPLIISANTNWEDLSNKLKTEAKQFTDLESATIV